MGPTPRHPTTERQAGRGFAGRPHNLKLKTNWSVIPGPAEACSQLRPRPSACVLQHGRLQEGPGKGVRFRPRGGRERGSQKPGSNLGASPGSTRRLSTSQSQQGRELEPRACVRPSDRSPALVPGDCASGAAFGIAGGGDGGAAVGRELRVRVPGRGRPWKRWRAGGGCQGAPMRGGGRDWERRSPGGPPPRSGPRRAREASHHLLLALAATAAAVERREQVEAVADAAADGGRQEGVVGAGQRVILEVAVAVALHLVAHDAGRGAVERGRQHVVRHIDQEPARAQHRDQLVLAQQREEVEAQGEQPEEHGHEEREVHRALVLAGGDSDPEGGAGQQLQHPQHAQRTAQEGPLQAHRAAGRTRLGRRLARGRREHGPRARRRRRRRRRPKQRNGGALLVGAARPRCPLHPPRPPRLAPLLVLSSLPPLPTLPLSPPLGRPRLPSPALQPSNPPLSLPLGGLLPRALLPASCHLSFRLAHHPGAPLSPPRQAPSSDSFVLGPGRGASPCPHACRWAKLATSGAAPSRPPPPCPSLLP
ncbi:hypothetical protein AAY473_013149 [Plecturocebus cupreus]